MPKQKAAAPPEVPAPVCFFTDVTQDLSSSFDNKNSAIPQNRRAMEPACLIIFLVRVFQLVCDICRDLRD